MKTVSRVLAALAISLAVGTAEANEEHKILKRQILSDCREAQASFSLLDKNSQDTLVPYLARVLELQLNTIRSLQGPLADPGHGFSISDPKAIDVSIPVDPAEELDAKRCALDLLGQIGKGAFSALPKIIELSQKPATPIQLKRIAALRARDIAQVFARDLATVSEQDSKTIELLLKYLAGPSAYVAHAAFLELGRHSVVPIVSYLSRASADEAAEMALVLQDLQSNGVAAAPNLYPLLSSGEELLQVRVINILVELHPPLHETLPPLVSLLDDISASVRETARSALKALVANTSAQPFSLESTVQDYLITTFRIAPPNEREEMLEWLPTLIGLVNGLEDRLVTLYHGAPVELKRDILLCITATKSPSSKSFTLVQAALKEEDVLLRAHAVRALGRFPAFESTSVKELTKVFQTLPPLKDYSERELFQDAAADALSSLHPKSVSEGVISPLIKMLAVRSLAERENEPYIFPKDRSPTSLRSRYGTHPAVKALVAIGEPARSTVEKTARPGNSDQARRAIAVLGQLPPQQSTVALLSSLLSSSHLGTKAEAARALLNFGQSVVPLLRKQSERLSGDAAVAISEVTILLGEKTMADSKKIYKSLAHADCPSRVQRVLLIADFSEQERSETAGSLAACIGVNHVLDHETIAALIRLAPLPDQQLNHLVELLRAPASSPQLRLLILDHAKELAISAETILPIFTQLLKDSRDALQVRLIRSIGRFGAINPELASQLTALLSNDDRYRTRNLAIVATLAKTSPASFNFGDWLKDELERVPLEPLKKTLRGFPDDFAESLLLRILPEVNDHDKEILLLLLSTLIRKHDQAPPALLPLLKSSDLSLKYEALHAISACCAITSATEEALRDLLYSSISARIAEVAEPPAISAALERITQESPFLSERAVAKRVLRLVRP